MNKLIIHNQPHEIFHSDITSPLYEERCIVYAEDNDIIITSIPIDNKYLIYLKEIGIKINCDRYVVTKYKNDLAYSILRDNKLIKCIKDKINSNFVIDTYIPNNDLLLLSDILGIKISFPYLFFNKFFNKSSLGTLSKLLQLPIPHRITLTKDNFEDACQFLVSNRECILKSDDTIGGNKVNSIKSICELYETIVKYKAGVMILEKKIVPKYEGSIQFIIENGKCFNYVVECEINNNIFSGFRFPNRFGKLLNVDLKKYALIIRNYLLSEGICDCQMGIDFIIDHNNNIVFHDFNPRKTSVGYVMKLLRRLRVEIFKNDGYEVVSRYITMPIGRKYCILEVKQLLKDNNLLMIDHNGLIIFNPNLLHANILHLISLSNKRCNDEHLRQAYKLIN